MTAQPYLLAQLDEVDSIALADDAECWSVCRQDIDFFNAQPGRVAIDIRVSNVTDQPSVATSLTLQAAPFGAFVPWQPLKVLRVPVLRPGQVMHLRTSASAPRQQPLGRPDRVPPRKLLTALGLADEPPGQPTNVDPTVPSPPAPGTMPPDLLQFLLQETPHWVGNLNVLVGATDVERHRALALRVYPGRLNIAWFIVGSRGRDAYAFRLSGPGDWQTNLFDMTSRQSLVLDSTNTPAIAPEQWIQTDGSRTMLLALRPPSDCAAGAIEVHVTQQSTGRTAVVEFSLDPDAQGRGCYAV